MQITVKGKVMPIQSALFSDLTVMNVSDEA